MTHVTDGPSELFSVRNALYMGDFQTVVRKAKDMIVSSDLQTPLNVLLYRARIALGEFDQVISEIKDNESTHVSLRAVRYLATYLNAAKQGKLSAMRESVANVNKLTEDPVQAQDFTLLTVASTIYLHEGNDAEALKCVHNPGSLELASIQVKGLIRIHRVDLAEIALRNMLDMNDDATISQLTTAYFAIAMGGQEKIEEATIIFQQLQKKFGNTPVVLNGLAVCSMHLGGYENAEKLLWNSLGASPNDPDTLVNTIVVGHHLKRGHDYTNKYLSQLAAVAPSHPWLKKYNDLDSDFDSAALAYSS